MADLSDEEIHGIASDGMRNAAGGIYETCVIPFAREVIAADRALNAPGDEREAFVSWLSGDYPHAWPRWHAEHAWQHNHVSALAWRHRASLPQAPAPAVPDHFPDVTKKVAPAVQPSADSLRAALAEADRIMGHDDAMTEWRERWAHLWGQEGTKAQPSADKANAERYRFLREDFSPMGLNIDGNHAWAYRRNATLKGPTLDAAIDAARARTGDPA